MSIRQTPGRHSAAAARPARRRHAAGTGSRRTAVVVAGTLALTGGGVAMAAWTAQGTGPGDAKAVSAATIVVDDLATATGDLFPGGMGDVVVRVQNPNPYGVQLTTAVYGTVTGGCAAGSVVPVQTEVTLPTPITLPANSATVTITLDDAVRMVSGALDACQGASFSVPVQLTGTSV